MNITGAILAGGSSDNAPSSRSGAFGTYNGEMLLDRQLAVLNELCEERIVVTDAPKPFLDVLDSKVRLITDYASGSGALGGLHAALHLSTHPLVWALACDMPLVTKDAAVFMAERISGYDAVVPVLNNRLQPWCSIYTKRCAKVASELLHNGMASPLVFLSFIHYKPIHVSEFVSHGIDPSFLYRMSHPHDLLKTKQSQS
ncbi:molybdenum cofactor guanylyltransferase [Paenibacillus sp. SYP-B4298]|uniref:molybdenum cofactor guanylyltransferase n=1 Tax=Paenibacillus sp. SYP-B4298 TaxID=2996034 RepID=UPI0022DDAB5B|nr:molybdenum cofactor guanylyltransferase [Paenibacillus sp. SYP-B4298]